LAGLLTFAAFVLLCFFYGTSVNASVFFLAAAALMAALTLIGSSLLSRSRGQSPAVSGLLALTLAALVVSYQWSLSKDSSFVPTWAIAVAPLTFLVVQDLGVWRSRLYALVSLAVVSFALVSLWQLVTLNERAMLPLTDANNYGSFLYMTLIVWLYVYLRRCWEGGFSDWPVNIAAFVLALIMFTAVFATQSRTSAVIVFGALAIFFLLALVRRRSVVPVLLFTSLAVVGYVAAALLVTTTNTFAAEKLAEGAAYRELLYAAALNIYQANPLTGAGIFVFPLLYRGLRSPLDQTTAGEFVHNDYLQFLAEGGPLLVIALIIFAGATLWRFIAAGLQMMPRGRRELPDANFGFVLALGAVLAHALVNFVMFTPVLAFLVGLNAAFVDWQSLHTVAQAKLKILRGVIVGLLIWGWLCVAYLGLDTLSVGVFQRQAGVPFASHFNNAPDTMLGYAQLAQRLNRERGLPVFVEAAMYQQQLSRKPDSEWLLKRTLDTYRRARLADPWNTNVTLQMYGFVMNYPRLAPVLTAQEVPEQLLAQTIELDPVFVAGYEAIISHYRTVDREEVAFELLRSRLTVWLPWLAQANRPAAQRFVAYLAGWAQRTGDAAYQAELELVAADVEAVQPIIRRTWFDD